MTAIFIGHGSPMNAIESNFFTQSWVEIVKKIRNPTAILVVSAHWQTDGTRIASSSKQKIIYDFYGFPSQLYEVSYEANGDDVLAAEISDNLLRNCGEKIAIDHNWGLDHGAWSVLRHLYPQPQMPILQLSLDRNKTPRQHYEFAKKLKFLQQKNILILGSGNIVHNLAMIDWRGKIIYDWAIEFSAKVKNLVQKANHSALIDFNKLAGAALAVPTDEHFLPLIYVLAQQNEGDNLNFFAEKIDLSAIDMTSLMID